jgi:hypothetical protein
MNTHREKESVMRADTRTISISAAPAKVVDFLAAPDNLPRWAVGFAKSVRQEEGRWLVATGGGDMEIRIDADSRSGVVDFAMRPAPGVEVSARSRVVPNGRGCEYVFTQFQNPGMSDEVFEHSVEALKHELVMLRALLEVECPL